MKGIGEAKNYVGPSFSPCVAKAAVDIARHVVTAEQQAESTIEIYGDGDEKIIFEWVDGGIVCRIYGSGPADSIVVRTMSHDGLADVVEKIVHNAMKW